MPPRACFRPTVLALRPRAQLIPVQYRPWLQCQRSYAHDSNLHPNPDVVPTTDPQSPGPSANPGRADGPTDGGVRVGNPDPQAQGNLEPKGPNMEQAPHVSEEAAAMSKATGNEGPDLEQGTPVAELLKDDPEARSKLPKVMQDALAAKSRSKSSPSQKQNRSFSTFAHRRLDTISTTNAYSDPPPGDSALAALQGNYSTSYPVRTAPSVPAGAPANREDQDYPGQYYEINDEEAMMIARGEVQHPDIGRAEAQYEAQKEQGLKFGELENGGRRMRHLKRRYESVVDQFTNMIMRHGMKSKAQRNMAEILTYLRTAPAPQSSSQRRSLPLPPHTPTVAHLPLNPTYYLQHALDSVAPLLRLRSQRGLMGGGVAVQLPVPLTLRQRRRTAICWILDAVEKRKGGTSGFSKRVAEEIAGIVEGKSSVWTKREAVQRLGVQGRTNLTLKGIKSGRR